MRCRRAVLDDAGNRRSAHARRSDRQIACQSGCHVLSYSETALTFLCGGERMLGILSRPDVPATRGVLIMVGGPQYRVGSHRQFLLLARHLAAHGVPALRFDYRGMGDSEGGMRTFEHVEDDLRAA